MWANIAFTRTSWKIYLKMSWKNYVYWIKFGKMNGLTSQYNNTFNQDNTYESVAYSHHYNDQYISLIQRNL